MKTTAMVIKSVAQPLTGAAGDYDPLLHLIGDARIVLMGAQAHGTHEFHTVRADVTKRLIFEKEFDAVAIEADWPDAYRVNRFVRGDGDDTNGEAALSGFTTFPAWMWRNAEMVDFVDWLRSYNQKICLPDKRIGFYGIDLYSLHKSIDKVVSYLDRIDPEAARAAKIRYSCFEHFGSEARRYGLAANLGLAKACRDEAVKECVELHQRRQELLQQDGPLAEEEFFSTEQNAASIADAEEYYRSMFKEREVAWNQREGHMLKTLRALATHFERQQRPGRIVVWLHNSHAGDARATGFAKTEVVSLGQLVREQWNSESSLIGLTTHSGTVTAASDWCDAPPQSVLLKPPPENSYEALFHQVGYPRFMLDLRASNDAVSLLHEPRLERVIGVVHRPDSRQDNHYLQARLTPQFDAVIHIDETHALEPIERTAEWDKAEVPETFPTGI